MLSSFSETSDGELSSDEEESAGGGGGGGAGKLLLRIRKEKLSSSSSSHHQDLDPVAKVLKFKKQPLLKKKLMAIYRSMVTKTDDDGRFLCELFMKRPLSSMYPQYYVVIKNPIDLKEILRKIRSETYLSMEELVSDVELMVENACTFNEEESQVYKVRREREREREERRESERERERERKERVRKRERERKERREREREV